MDKQKFLAALRRKLSDLPRRDIEERLSFYGEMIDDMVEEGKSIEVAVSEIGDVSTVAEQIRRELAVTDGAAGEEKAKGGGRALSITLLALGSPVWLSILISVCAVIISLYAALWSVIISIWSVFVSLVCCTPAGLVLGIVSIIGGNVGAGGLLFGISLACFGLSIFLFFGCREATKAAIKLSKISFVGIKACLSREGKK